MWAWILAKWALPSVRKWTFYVVAGLAICYAAKLWLNGHDARVRAENRTTVVEEYSKLKEAEWKLKDEALAAERKAFASERQSVVEQRNFYENQAKGLAAARQADREVYLRGLTAVQTKLEVERGQTSRIPADQLDGELRRLITELTAASSPIRD